MKFDLSFWGLTLLLVFTTTLPLKMAAEIVGAKRTSMAASGLAAMVGIGLAWGAIYYVGVAPDGVLAAFLLVVLSYKFILKPPMGHSLWLAVIATTLQMAFIFALVSFGKYQGITYWSF